MKAYSRLRKFVCAAMARSNNQECLGTAREGYIWHFHCISARKLETWIEFCSCISYIHIERLKQTFPELSIQIPEQHIKLGHKYALSLRMTHIKQYGTNIFTE